MLPSQDQFRLLAAKHGLTPAAADALWRELVAASAAAPRPRFDIAHVAYYLGALVVIGAMGWFMTNAWDLFAGFGLAGVALGYGLLFLLLGRRFWLEPERRIPGGLLLTAAVCMVPLLVYGLEKGTGLWPAGSPGSFTHYHPYIHGSWVLMEIATVAAGLLALRRWRFPFLTAPIAHALWFLSLDLAALLATDAALTWEERRLVTVGFGAVMLLATYGGELKWRARDFAFWGYLFGLAAFWGGLTSMDSQSEWAKAGYGLLNLALIGLALLLRRTTFMVFGALGVFGYLMHLAHAVWKDSFAFPFVLSALGLGIIYAGIHYQRHRAALEAYCAKRLRPTLRRWLPPAPPAGDGA